MKNKETILQEIIDLSTWFQENGKESIESVGKYQIWPEYFELLKNESINEELFENVEIYDNEIHFTAKENGKRYQIKADIENSFFV